MSEASAINETVTENKTAISLTRRIFECIQASGTEGMTCEEITAALGTTQKVSGRVFELIISRKVVDSGLHRLTRAGRNAYVYVARVHR
jgi:hypothetical protein